MGLYLALEKGKSGNSAGVYVEHNRKRIVIIDQAHM
jgi:hypothetical protein